jgi:pimeloyl-ACP methyl ester carboxylesterase
MTEFSLVYLHGFAGSYRDGFPVNVKLADTLGANLFLARLAGHGLRPVAALDNFSPEAVWNSAREALAIGKKIGKKVIILSTSTGGTLALKLAAEFPEEVYALINLSPNIEDDVDAAFLLNSPWGYELAELVSFGDHRKIVHEQEIAARYWDTIYPSKALVDLQVLLATTMTKETFEQVSCPVLTLYYQENFLEEDEHVEVEVYPKVHEQLSTPDSLKELVKLEEPKTHFLGSDIKSRNTEVVLKTIVEFLKEDLHIDLNNL